MFKQTPFASPSCTQLNPQSSVGYFLLLSIKYYGFKSLAVIERDSNPRTKITIIQWVDSVWRLPVFYIKAYLFPCFIAFRCGDDSISQRENQLHGKILLKTLIFTNRVRLDKEFGSFFIYDSIFRSNPLVVDFLHCNLFVLLPCFGLTVNNDYASLTVYNANTGEVTTLTDNSFQLTESAEVIIIIKQKTTKGTIGLTASIE